MGKSVTESISAAQVGEKWSDISFRCSDQDEKDEAIKAHKFILASRSPVFEAMFFGAMKETNDEIKLDDITAETFQLFLRYLYTDDVDLNYKTSMELVQVAHKYRVSKCVKFCTDFLKENITHKKACAILQLALLLDLTDLEYDVMKHIERNTVSVLGLEEFLETNLETLARIIRSSRLNIDETVVFKYVDMWATKRCEEQELEVTGPNKRAVLQDAFDLIRFRIMTVKDFIRIMYQKNYFTIVEYEEIVADIIGFKSLPRSKYGGKRQRGLSEFDVDLNQFDKFEDGLRENLRQIIQAARSLQES